MKIIIIGPPGSGKGTYASLLGVRLKIEKISTGDIFRESIKRGTEMGERVAEYLESGQLVPDDIVVRLIKESVNASNVEKGFILDGYPRTLYQAKALEEIVKIDAIIDLIVPEWVIVERLSNRRVCGNCGAVYNVKYNFQPKRQGFCDKCGGELHQRSDDRPEIIKERLSNYEEQIHPIIAYYRGRVPFIEAECLSVETPPEIVVEDILKGLERLKLIE